MRCQPEVLGILQKGKRFGIGLGAGGWEVEVSGEPALMATVV